MQQAIIYTRFSTLEQRDGVSLERQLERCQELATELDLEIERIVSDQGKSGFHGRHRMNGAGLAELEKEIVAGHHRGKTILIEKISRLSREDPNDSFDLMRSITRNGVTLACWDGRLTYRAGENPDFMSVIQFFLTAKMVHEESAAKADFGRDRWKRRRDAMASGTIASALGPSWLKLSEDRTAWLVIDEGKGPNLDRGEIVRAIFDMADGGLGSHTIAQSLNASGIAPWPRFEGEKRKAPKAWSRGTVLRIMQNPAAIGDHQPMMTDDHGKSVAAGEPIRGYFPRIVQPDVFDRVQAMGGSRKDVRGRRSAVVANLVSGLCLCEVCGGVMEYVRGRRAGSVINRKGREPEIMKIDTASLRCRVAAQKLPESDPNHCDNRRNIAYLGMERALLDSCLHLAMDDGSFAQNDVIAAANVEIADLRRDCEIATKKAVNLWEAYAEEPSDMAKKLAQKAEQTAAEITSRIADLEEKRRKAGGAVTAIEHMTRLAAIRERLYAEDLDDRAIARSMVATGLRSVIEKIMCHEDGTSTVTFKHGLRMIQLVPGSGRRPSTFIDWDLSKRSRLDRLEGSARKIAESVLRRSDETKQRAPDDSPAE
ncbi:recombinase family protein [Novosphingobium sp.]|jgi:DNA invertase Pin-like site-specific DNA recombinase|uniref:recombinase family protein n=1 Tax=Novosphingobium sp. TaxID=1874826 RepID=UPI002FE14F8A